MSAPEPLFEEPKPSPRERFLAGILAQWMAVDRAGADAQPLRAERERAAEIARTTIVEYERR